MLVRPFRCLPYTRTNIHNINRNARGLSDADDDGISHPLIFIMLILCDILENAFCLWSLHRTIRGVSTRTNKIVPEHKEADEDTSYDLRKTLTKRSSSVYSLMKDLDETTSTEERQGTALFIAATLLQRELIETFVPIQAMGIISLLYSWDVNPILSCLVGNQYR